MNLKHTKINQFHPWNSSNIVFFQNKLCYTIISGRFNTHFSLLDAIYQLIRSSTPQKLINVYYLQVNMHDDLFRQPYISIYTIYLLNLSNIVLFILLVLINKYNQYTILVQYNFRCFGIQLSVLNPDPEILTKKIQKKK